MYIESVCVCVCVCVPGPGPGGPGPRQGGSGVDVWGGMGPVVARLPSPKALCGGAGPWTTRVTVNQTERKRKG